MCRRQLTLSTAICRSASLLPACSGSVSQRIWRLSQFLLRTSEHNSRPAVAAGQRLGERSLTTADHSWMRERCQTSTELVKAESEPAPGTIFTVSEDA